MLSAYGGSLRLPNSVPVDARPGHAFQGDAASPAIAPGETATSVWHELLISTDPPYYDNIGYADLSDFFYVWLRRSLRAIFPDLFSMLVWPKAEELIATPYRHASKAAAEAFFLDGMTQAMQPHRRPVVAPRLPGHDLLRLQAVGGQGRGGDGQHRLGDLPRRRDPCRIRDQPALGRYVPNGERRSISIGTNALASSIILVCRPRPADAPVATRREFVEALKSELPGAVRRMQADNIAPVDLAQAAIGPGMAVFTRYREVLSADGSKMSVRDALALINATLDEVLAEQEGDFDADTRWALAWFEQSGFAAGDYGVAETLSTAKNTSVSGMVRAGIVRSGAGDVRLLRPEELPADWDPERDARLTVWEMVHHLVRVHDKDSEAGAAELLARLGAGAEPARELAYRLYRICEQKKRSQEALAYNALIRSWPEIAALTRARTRPEQVNLFR